jgi:hypothetical protein
MLIVLKYIFICTHVRLTVSNVRELSAGAAGTTVDIQGVSRAQIETDDAVEVLSPAEQTRVDHASDRNANSTTTAVYPDSPSYMHSSRGTPDVSTSPRSPSRGGSAGASAVQGLGIDDADVQRGPIRLFTPVSPLSDSQRLGSASRKLQPAPVRQHT